MAVQIHINGENAQEALKELSGLTALLGNPVAVAPAAPAVQEPATQEEAPKPDKPKGGSRSKQKQEEAAPVEPEAKPDDAAEDPVQTEEPETEPAEPELPEDDAPTYTVEQVRAKLAELAKAGKADQVKALLKEFEVPNITALDPSQYAAVMAKAAEIE